MHDYVSVTLPVGAVSTSKGSRRPGLTIAAEIAAILAVVGPLVWWGVTHLHAGGPEAPAGSPSAAVRATATGGAVTAGATPTAGTVPADRKGQLVYLADQLAPETGGANRGALPHLLDGKPGYDHALVIPCATNQATDKFRSITYVLNRHYAALHATLRPYIKSGDESVLQIQVFLDQQPPAGKNIQVNTADTIDVDVFGATKMEVRITCESPDATAILADAYLRHS